MGLAVTSVPNDNNGMPPGRNFLMKTNERRGGRMIDLRKYEEVSELSKGVGCKLREDVKWNRYSRK